MTITVCSKDCDYQSIQLAVYAAKPNDAIEVHSGTYNESVILTKDINFKGTDTGDGEPIVNGGLYKNGFSSSLRGFSFLDYVSGVPYSYKMMNPNTTLYRIENASEVSALSSSKGLNIINSVLKSHPEDAWAWYRKGNILFDAQRYEESIDAYNESLKFDPYFSTSWNNLGYNLYMLKRYDESLQAYDKAIEINPHSDIFWNNKGNTLFYLGEYNESIQAYDKAIEINPQYTVAFYNKATVLNRQGNYDEAIGAFDEAISINPQYAAAWNDKGLALQQLGRTTEANAAFSKAKELGYSG
ncbi:Photosystem I assembly protein Ycf3 [uncultured archaeon]|nr:Photosystem I assembly protein Ycf3 [uncultured archaeon]